MKRSMREMEDDLMENTTLLSTRALLLALEIENNAEVDYKAQNHTNMKGAKGKRKMESIDSHIPKKPKRGAGLTSMCSLQEAWGVFKSHDMRSCHHFNKDGTPTKGHGDAGRPQKEKKRKGTNFAQTMHAELKRAMHKHLHKSKKCCSNYSDSDSDSDESA